MSSQIIDALFSKFYSLEGNTNQIPHLLDKLEDVYWKAVYLGNTPCNEAMRMKFGCIRNVLQHLSSEKGFPQTYSVDGLAEAIHSNFSHNYESDGRFDQSPLTVDEARARLSEDDAIQPLLQLVSDLERCICIDTQQLHTLLDHSAACDGTFH
ncbi:hypothetical protein EC973_003655 [Apophysomyces ossiformis]|uniref:Uncharacterized protein n=1 Tax=Apophysomyces ossiformis TaxID=679940 RepID=A0A8H7BHR9_9FUNG|nr:hypothetical protein EC973_003655 [Apophysomyces ossiformis]